MAEKYAWSRLEHEPVIWYERFIKYYLPLGPNRSLFKAYKAYIMIEDQRKVEGIDEKDHTTPVDWSEAADKWEWIERAMSYDEKMFTDDGIIELARAKLRGSALAAAEALFAALNDNRLRVSAAKEILDRVGVLAATVTLNKDVDFTSDEMADAIEDVKRWEENVKNG